MIYCRACGTAVDGAAFCRSCGAPTAAGAKAAADATQLASSTQALPRAWAESPTGGPGGKSSGPRTSMVIAIVAGVLALAAVTVLAAVLLGGGGSETATPTTRVTLPKTGGRTGTTATTAPDLVRPAMLEIERLLIDSGTARKTLNDTILNPFQDCALSAEVAYDQMESIIANRTRIRDAAAVLAQNADPTVRDLGAKLQAALQASLDSDFKYQTWMGEYRYNPSCPSQLDPMKQAANADSRRATAAKRVFVNAYNQIAAKYQMRTWVDTEI